MSTQLLRSIDEHLLGEVSEALRKKKISHYVTPKTPKTWGAVWVRDDNDMTSATALAERVVAEHDRSVKSLFPKSRAKASLPREIRKNPKMAVFALAMIFVLAVWYFAFIAGYAT